MVKVECDGCKAPYQVDEKRIPPTGLKMRCPKCGTNLLVMRPGAAPPPAESDLPAVAGKPKGPPGAPPPPPRGGPPRPPPPRAPAPAPGRQTQQVDDADIMEEPKPRFGTIELQVDLPAPGADLGQEDLPAVAGPRPPPYGAPYAPAPPPPAAPFGFGMPDGYGDADLPAVPGGDADLPAVPRGAPQHADLPAVPAARGRTVQFGDIDLPAPPAAGAKAPRQRSRTVNFGDIDLPSVPGLGDVPGIHDLPQVAQQRGFGEIDLPMSADDGGLPMSADPNAGLPVYGGGGLPAPAYGAGLPAPAYGAGLPAAAPGYGPGLPAPAYGGGLPAPAYGSGLPMPAQGGGLPMVMQGGGLPMPAQGGGLPMAAPGGGLPMPAQGGGLPMPMPGGGLPMSAQATGLPAPGFGDLPQAGGGWDAPVSSGRANAFDDSDRAVPSQMDDASAPMGSVGIELGAPTRAEIGGEADLAADAGASAPVVVTPDQQQRRPREEAPVKKSNARRVALVAGVLVAITGGAMAMVPSVGPFGAYALMDKINAGSNTAALDALKKEVGTLLDEDTNASATAAIERCKAGRDSMKRFHPTEGFCAYASSVRGLRFGRRADDEALVKQLVAAAGDDGGDGSVMANAALDVVAGQTAKASGPAAAVAQRSPQDLEAATLVAHVELASKSGAKAVDAWKRAVGIRKNPRTLFGLALALEAQGDKKGAEENARAVMAASPQHSGARVMVARLTWRDPSREAEALSLLKQVTEAGPVSKAAAESELVNAFTLLGNIHLARSRMSAAEQAFASALKIDPLAINALMGNGELFFRSSRYSEALSRFEAASKVDVESIAAKVGIAKAWIALERMKEAKDMLKGLRSTKPNEPLVALWMGKAEEVLGNRKEAEVQFTEAIKLGENKPEVVDAYVALAHLLTGGGRNDEANAKLAEASKKFPDFPALHRAKGEVALQTGRFEEARQEFEAALAKEEDLTARFKLGETLRHMRKFEEASATFDKVAAIDKDYPGLALQRGLIWEETGQSDKALESYQEALKKTPNDVDVKMRVGSTLVIAGHVKDAQKILEEVRKERPNSAEVNHFLGRALLVEGRNLAEAMRYLERAVAIDSNRAEYFLYVGWAANELAQPLKASPALTKALELDQGLADAYWQRGVMLQRQGANVDALKDLQTALEKRPSRYEAWATIALCYQDLQKPIDAENAWRKAIGGNDTVAEWHYRLGKLLSGHGNHAVAGAELSKAVEIAEGPDQPPHPWLFDACFLGGEALKTSPTPAGKARALELYQKFKELAPKESPYLPEAEKAIAALEPKKR